MSRLCVLTWSLDCECSITQNFLSWACALCCLTSAAGCSSLMGCTATATAQWLDMTPKISFKNKKWNWISSESWNSSFYVWWLWNLKILESKREICLWSCGGLRCRGSPSLQDERVTGICFILYLKCLETGEDPWLIYNSMCWMMMVTLIFALSPRKHLMYQ